MEEKRKWYEDDDICGFINEDGSIEVICDKNLTDADTDKYSAQVQNGEGYYNYEGRYISYNLD